MGDARFIGLTPYRFCRSVATSWANTRSSCRLLHRAWWCCSRGTDQCSRWWKSERDRPAWSACARDPWRGPPLSNKSINATMQSITLKQGAITLFLGRQKITAYFGFPVNRDRSRNSSWIVVTSDVLESGPHRGAWALPVDRLTSEKGTGDFEEKAGSRRSPISIYTVRVNKNVHREKFVK